MKNIVTVAQRELSVHFFSPIAYGVLTLFLAICGLMFSLNTLQPGAEASVRAVFGGWMLLLLVIFLSLMTMRALSEEFRSGTIETLMTAPVTDAEVIVGKFFGVFVFFCVMLAGTVIFPIVIGLYGGIDLKLTLSCYLGLLMVGALYIAVGVFFSACTRSQVVAGLSSAVVLSVLTFLAGFVGGRLEGRPRVVLQHLSIADHYEAFLRGLIDTTHVVFFVSVTWLVLFFAVRALEFRRWR